jgi:hypothetical protein
MHGRQVCCAGHEDALVLALCSISGISISHLGSGGKQMELRILRAINRRNWELWIWIRAVALKAHGHFRSPVPWHYTEMAWRVAGGASSETRASGSGMN